MPEVDLPSLLAAFPDAVLTIDRESTILFVNDAACRIFGFSREQFIGRSLVESIIPPELRSQHVRGMERFHATGTGPVIGRRIDITACDASGRRFPIELCVFLEPSRSAGLIHATIRETTDRMAREAVFSAERERLRQILDATADVWWDCAVGGGTRFSDSAQQVLGVGSAELTMEPSRLPGVHPDDRGRVADAWLAHLEGKVGRYECTHRLLLANGDVRWIRQRGRAVEFDAGRPTRVVGTIADVTEQQAADERLRNAQRLEMLGLLAGGFAHDLNNYLTAIRGHSSLAATEPGVTAAAHESFAAIQLATTKARMLATNMLSLGKPSVDAISRFSACAAIEEAVELIRPGLPRTISISVDSRGAEGFEIELDPTAFQQALLNLVINARDAMPAGGRLRIEALHVADPLRGPMLRIVVEDTGAGIAPEVLARIFEPFFTTKPKGVGTGLGLAVVHQVAVGAGGSVSVESDLGRGTRFIITLPAHAASAPRSAPPEQDRHRVVLVAESHPVLRPMLVEALKSANCTVIESDSRERGLALARARSAESSAVDVVVCEISGGRAAASQAQAEFEAAFGRPVALLAMSSQPDASHDSSRGATAPQASASGSGAPCVLLVKPFDVAELLSAVESLAN